jgi:hypothetical protein
VDTNGTDNTSIFSSTKMAARTSKFPDQPLASEDISITIPVGDTLSSSEDSLRPRNSNLKRMLRGKKFGTQTDTSNSNNLLPVIAPDRMMKRKQKFSAPPAVNPSSPPESATKSPPSSTMDYTASNIKAALPTQNESVSPTDFRASPPFSSGTTSPLSPPTYSTMDPPSLSTSPVPTSPTQNAMKFDDSTGTRPSPEQTMFTSIIPEETSLLSKRSSELDSEKRSSRIKFIKKAKVEEIIS